MNLSDKITPAKIEREDRLLHRLLCHHVVENRVSQDLCQGRVTHPQYTIESGRDKCSTRLVDRLPELLILGDQTPNLEQKTTKYSCQTSVHLPPLVEEMVE